MAIIKEDYVSFETAKLLKEKGFKTPVETGYYGDGRICHNIALDFMDYNHEDGYYSRPTIQMVMKWLREVHNVAIVVTPSMFWGRYNTSIYKKGNDYPYGFDGGDLVPSYEQACENAIKYCLKTLI